MTTFRTKAFSIQCSEGKTPEKIQLFRTGTFHHSEYGTFEITPAVLASMVANFTSNVRGVDLAIDYKHENDDIAAGWIKNVELSEDGTELWATVEWTPNGQKVLSDKEFRYMSPEFSFEYEDNETLKKFGPTLFGGGLTNRPTIKHMEPVVELQEGAQQAPKNPPQKPKEVKAMDYKTMDPAAVDALGPDELKAMCKDMLAEMKKVGEAAAAQAAEKAMSEKKQKFTVMMSEGKAVKAQEEAYLTGDMDQFAALASPQKLNEGSGSGAGPSDETIETKEQAQEVILKKATALMSEKKIGSMGTAIQMALKDNPALSKKIYG